MIMTLNTRLIASHRASFLFTFLLLFCPVCVAYAQPLQQVAQGTPPDIASQRIRQQLIDLNRREMANASNRELGFRWTVLGFEYSNTGEFTSSENAFNHAIDLLSRDPADAGLNAEALDQLGALYRVYGRLPESLNCRRKALALRIRLGDAKLIALSKSHLAEIALVSRQYRNALQQADEAYTEMMAAGSDNHDRVGALVVQTYATCGLHRHAECLSRAEELVALARGAYPEQSSEVSSSLMALSVAQLRNGLAAAAEDSARQGLAILRTQFSSADPRVAFALSQDRDCLVALHRKDEARQVQEQLAASQSKSSAACAQCTVSAFGLRSPDR